VRNAQQNTEPEKNRAIPKPVLIGILVAVLIGGAFLGYFSLLYKSPNPCSVLNSTGSAPGVANSTVGSTAYFTIIESDPGNNYEGMNGSAYHLSTPWPVMQVFKGQTVVIHVINCASSESHGFAVAHYFVAGTTVRTGQSYTLTFNANQAGTFRVYCSIFCAIHPLMQNGELIVS
jgi:heme/copper-type cytochrome/quinol oxidase subunit 2